MKPETGLRFTLREAKEVIRERKIGGRRLDASKAEKEDRDEEALSRHSGGTRSIGRGGDHRFWSKEQKRRARVGGRVH